MSKKDYSLLWYFGFMIAFAIITLCGFIVEMEAESSCVAAAIKEGMPVEYIQQACK